MFCQHLGLNDVSERSDGFYDLVALRFCKSEHVRLSSSLRRFQLTRWCQVAYLTDRWIDGSQLTVCGPPIRSRDQNSRALEGSGPEIVKRFVRTR